ncbi:hypothetical protein L6164_010865 [Bauhinia variegata]|uniref:Uncharacterized protein n=1 Tax=Bauhinia variegata TaxID=167791 RepID=A0ACB9P5A9_BAUVA|nr:hypothetical protein L6164_010865 [Bauhinia variegata]
MRQDTGADKVRGDCSDIHHRELDIELIGGERVGHSGPLKKELDEDGGSYVEVTMDIHGDSVALHSIKTVAGSEIGEDEKLGLLGKGLEKKTSFGPSLIRNASIRMKQVSQELKRFASFSKRVPSRHNDRTKSAAVHGLKGLSALKELKFINKTDDGAGWAEVEKQFDKLTATTHGYLPRSLCQMYM